MLGLSSKTLYAIAALFELDTHNNHTPRKIKDIATAANIPQNFLEQILLSLKKAGVLTSTKGAHGGYTLQQPLDSLTLADVIGILEDGYFDFSCKSNQAALKLFWTDVQQESLNTLNKPLSHFSDYRNQINQTLDYSI